MHSKILAGERDSRLSETTHSHSLLPSGERMLPGVTGANTFWEHVLRYRFAAKHVVGKRVLDVACGTGYGSAALSAAGAASVVGIDIEQSACSYARGVYGVRACRATADVLPVPDASIDVLVSFETIEHLASPLRFLDECRRVLAPQGTLIISTPEKAVYARSGTTNPYHVHEFTEKEFSSALSQRFTSIRWYSQKPALAGWSNPFAFAADRSPWQHVPLVRRWQYQATQRVAKLRGAVESLTPDDVSRLILRSDPLTTYLTDPYAVRPRQSHTTDLCEYLIARVQL